MSYKYFIRIDDRSGYLEKVKDLCATNGHGRFSSILCVSHEGRKTKNPHYHLAIECDYKKQALRVAMKLIFDQGKGNAHMSIKDWDGNPKVCSYMFSDPKWGLIYSSYNNDELEEFKKQNEEVQDKLKKNAPNAIVTEVCLRLRKSNRFCHSHEQICFMIWDILKERGDWFPNKFQLERWIFRVQGELSDTESSWSRTKKDWYLQMFNSR